MGAAPYLLQIAPGVHAAIWQGQVAAEAIDFPTEIAPFLAGALAALKSISGRSWFPEAYFNTGCGIIRGSPPMF